jgi:hypothetical protein
VSLRSLFLSTMLAGLTASASYVRSEQVSPNAVPCTSCFRGLPAILEDIPGSVPLKKTLKSELYFTDPTGTVWKANVGDITDGASIPEVFVPLVGDRFEPDFLPAAIIHDHYTDDEHKVRLWTDTARVFYQAMVTNQTPISKAKVMYYAVYTFGPHWGHLKPGQFCGDHCINVVPHNYVIESNGSDKKLEAVSPSAVGGFFYVEPPHASTTDVPELTDVKKMVEAAEVLGNPMSLGELERQATIRHPEKVFLAIAAQAK